MTPHLFSLPLETLWESLAAVILLLCSALISRRGCIYWITQNTFQNEPEHSLLLDIHSCLLRSLLYSPGSAASPVLMLFSQPRILLSCFSSSLSSFPPFLSVCPLPPLAPNFSPSSCIIRPRLILHLVPAEAPGQDFVTLDYHLRYYPSITYSVIGSAVIFVLVVALLALVLHHQRKRSVLLPRSARGTSHHYHHHQPLLLSRLVILDRGHVHPGPGLSPSSSTAAGQYSSTPQALQLLSGTLYPSGLPMDSPPSYSQAVLDVR